MVNVVSPQARDYILKLAAWVAAVVVVLPIGASVVGIFYFGDGEGLKILSNMTAPILGGLGAFVSVLLTLLAHIITANRDSATVAVANVSATGTPVAVDTPLPPPVVPGAAGL